MVQKRIAVYIVIVLYCIINVITPESAQIMDSLFPYPIALVYMYGLLLTPMYGLTIIIWKCYRFYFNLSTIIIRKRKVYNFIGYSLLGVFVYQICSALYVIEMEGHMLTVPTDTAINGMSPIPTLIFSILFLNQKLNWSHIMAILTAMIGILLFVFEVAKHENRSDETYDTYTGIILKIISSTGFALYTVILKKMCINCLEKDKFIIGNILYALVTSVIFSVICPWFLFYPTEIEINMFTSDIIAWLCANGFVWFLFKVIQAACIALTTPFYMSIALTLCVPMSFVVDVFVHDYKFNWFAIVGAGFMVMSFVIMEFIKPNDKMRWLFRCCNDEVKCEVKNEINKNGCKEDALKGLLVNISENINYGTVRNV